MKGFFGWPGAVGDVEGELTPLHCQLLLCTTTANKWLMRMAQGWAAGRPLELEQLVNREGRAHVILFISQCGRMDSLQVLGTCLGSPQQLMSAPWL